MEYVERTYRSNFCCKDLVHFQVKVKETDLDIGISKKSYSDWLIKFTKELVTELRAELEAYIEKDIVFKTTLSPHKVDDTAPAIAKEMALAGQIANVGPMAAVAGAFAEYIGKELRKYSSDVIIENGGDIYMYTTKKRRVGVFAGQSPFSNRIAIEIMPEMSPIGICTSSGTVGPSFSFGKADAAVVLAKTGALADAVATAVGNVVQLPEDVEKGVNLAAGISDVLGVLVIKNNKMAVWGKIKLVPL